MTIKLHGPGWEIDNIKAILFDKDGTIIDSHKYWGAIIKRRSKALISELKLNRSFYQRICYAMGLSLKKQRLLPKGPIALVSRERVIKILTLFFKKNDVKVSKKTIDIIFSKVHQDFLKDIFKYIRILPGAKETLSEIKKKNVKTALITSDSVDNAKQTIKHLGLEDCFDLIVGRELTPSAKSTGVAAKLTCKILNINPSDTICIGDAPMDVLMAKNAKLKACVGVALGQTPYLELRKKTKYSIKRFSDLMIK